ncbi:MAG: protein kinase [Acidobacteriota bacterium]
MGRYQTAVALSAGGTAEIYKAYDPTLQRYVALKFLHRDDPAMVERMFREARAQARLEHEGICKVYEVGELDGRPYIAMQFIDGEELGVAAHRMTLEEKVQVMWRVALAVHAAHKEGLIHRDIKPANIMVQETDDGQLRPVVVDFGLVWEHTYDSMTQAGQVLGTPPYLAPEQVEGRRELLDRRTDVYGLGATLYDLIAGRPPFVGELSVQLMMKTVREEPQSMRRLDPSIPADLDTIVLKCLEKERQRRFETAAALADDLRRFLDGEPIAARPASLSYRLQKKVRKHRSVVAVSLVALSLVLATTLMGLRTRWRSEQRLAYEQRFSQVGKDVDWTMRAVYMSSLHDIGGSKQDVRDRIASIETELPELGELGAAPAHYAIGRCYIVLQEDDRAQHHLEQAWQLGFRTPEVAYALGLTLGRQYELQLKQARNVSSRTLREEQIAEIERAYRDPAIEHLRIGREAEAVATEYVEALIALYEERYDEALTLARTARQRLPWLYEAQVLEGTILTQRGDYERLNGDFEAARASYRSAEPAYREAMASAGSDPRSYIGLCDLATSRMRLEVQGRAEKLLEDLEQALSFCGQATRIDDELGAPHTLRANAYRIQARHQTWSGDDPMPSLETARELARRGVELEPDDFSAHVALGTVDLQEGEYLMAMRRGDPRPICRQAEKSYRRALEIQPNDPIAMNVLGSLHVISAQYELRNGIDPMSSLNQAVEIFEAAIEVTPESYDLHHNLANVYGLISGEELERGLDFSASTAAYAEHRARALEINPDGDWANLGMSDAYSDQATVAYHYGGEVDDLMRQALSAVERAIELNPKNTEFYNRRVGYYSQLAYYQLMQDIDPSESLAGAQQAVDELRAMAPDRVESYGRQVIIGALAARWAAKQAAPSLPYRRAALEALETMAEIARDGFFFQASTDFLQYLAYWELVVGRDPTATIERGLTITEEALGVDPDNNTMIATRGALRLLAARVERDPAARQRLLEQSEADMSQALANNRWLSSELVPWLDQARSLLGRGPEVEERVD